MKVQNVRLNGDSLKNAAGYVNASRNLIAAKFNDNCFNNCNDEKIMYIMIFNDTVDFKPVAI